jgi:hypothetical protein
LHRPLKRSREFSPGGHALTDAPKRRRDGGKMPVIEIVEYRLRLEHA